MSAVQEQALAAFAARVDGDADRAYGHLVAVGELGGMAGAFQACRVWAEIVLRMGLPGRGDDDFVAVTAPEGTDERDSRLWALRFIAAHANGDADASWALFSVLADDDDAFNAGTLMVLDMAVRVAMRQEEHRLRHVAGCRSCAARMN